MEENNFVAYMASSLILLKNKTKKNIFSTFK